MDPAQLKLLIAEGEGLMVEFKEKYTSKIDRDIVALANTKGGYILLGVSDDRRVTGEKLTNQLKAEIASLARNCRRNPVIADLFHRMGKVERLGTGVKRMRDLMRKAGLNEPEFTSDTFFHAVFRRDPKYSLKQPGGKTSGTGLAGGLVDGLVDGLAENQKKIYEAMQANPAVSKKQLAKLLGISTTAIDKNIQVLRRKLLIRRMGPDRGGHWEVAPK